jgi:ABC-type multidrug transport system fused ATPase/permease subunit
MQVFHFILQNLDHYRRRFILIILLGFINGAIGFLIPALLAEFTRQNFTPERLVQLLVSIAGLFIVSLGLQWVLRNYGERMAFQFGNHIREKYFHKIEHLTVQQLQQHHSGYVLSLINKIGDGLDMILFYIPYALAPGLATIGLFFYFTARASLWLAIINLLLLVSFVWIGTLLARRMVPLSSEQNKHRASLIGSYADFMANITTIKKLGIHQFAEKTIHQKTIATAKQIDRVQLFHANRWLLLHSLYGAAYLTTIGFLLWEVSLGHIASSILILFVSAYAILRSQIEQLAENIKSYMEMSAYISNLEDIIGSDTSDMLGRQIPHDSWQALRLQNVTFRYPGGTQTIAVDDFTLKRGSKVCILGKSGQGKSTFLNLLANELQPQEGHRLVDDIPYDSLSPTFFSDNLAVVSQDVELFNISVRENLVLGQVIDDDKITKLLQELDMGEWLAQLNDGLSTRVGEKGVTISAGQKQRLNILRSILLDREIYALDEPTSHLDAATEERVISFLRNHLGHKTVVIITHRPALRDLCNTTYEMADHHLRR